MVLKAGEKEAAAATAAVATAPTSAGRFRESVVAVVCGWGGNQIVV